MRLPLANLTGPVPTGAHPGAFGVARKFDVHTGVDLYCSRYEPVYAMCDGRVVNRIESFTGPDAGSPWWYHTSALMVEDTTGVWLYGEVTINPYLKVGHAVKAGDLLGHVVTVLKVDKGRPMAMLHLERYRLGTRDHVDAWGLDKPQPESLVDPTPYLLGIPAVALTEG